MTNLVQKLRHLLKIGNFISIEARNVKFATFFLYQKKSTGNYRTRKRPYFLVKSIENNNVEITISAGFTFQNNSEVQISFKDKKFNIFTFENLAWSYNISQDLDIVKEMKKNNFLEIYAINKYGRYSKDQYSLDGFNQAYHKITQICNKL